ncbi:hypothetical protein PBT90_10190 [Algoriphagus halophytocola]|uniref:CHRD domain-containing protein n=1 Tax=Algoriphagus halophytocola TaxID=2991499 RepID=A0ABY6MIY8_9BACT|nr:MULTISPECIES: hypothetical protein [unclassified Algoriphagus]UZD23757.1 hypothetical protein OM944_04520 [Algoriphagus sp. TR-M5]WBL45051.1 hypothetical protein PBT90_10190 [Algoriphagus sp. TR-M9]
MKKALFYLFCFNVLISCVEPDPFTGQKLEYTLHQASEFDYTGTLTVREKTDGSLQFDINLIGQTNESGVSFPAHLHYGDYTDPEAPMAAMLNPVSGANLSSMTEVSSLMDGTSFTFEHMKNFDGHVKVHLASEGPDYEVILVAGNVGSNPVSSLDFDPTQMTLCLPN